VHTVTSLNCAFSGNKEWRFSFGLGTRVRMSSTAFMHQETIKQPVVRSDGVGRRLEVFQSLFQEMAVGLDEKPEHLLPKTGWVQGPVHSKLPRLHSWLL
jgi:hypothetical protein